MKREPRTCARLDVELMRSGSMETLLLASAKLKSQELGVSEAQRRMSSSPEASVESTKPRTLYFARGSSGCQAIEFTQNFEQVEGASPKTTPFSLELRDARSGFSSKGKAGCQLYSEWCPRLRLWCLRRRRRVQSESRCCQAKCSSRL